MKTLKDILLESSKSAYQYLLLSYDDAVNYFEEYNILKNKDIIKTGLTLEDIKDFYEYAEENNMPCPIVANYQKKPGKFVFRRWVGKKFDEELSSFDMRKNAGPYQGLHNTRLKENGKYFPSSEDFEFVIAYSHNKNNINNENDIIDDSNNIEFVTKKTIETDAKLEQLMLYYAQNEDDCLNMVKPLSNINSALYKATSTNVTSEWIKLGKYKEFGNRSNKTPKTDLISKDGNYKISLKKAKGSQLMSGAECEARATLLSCIDYINNDNDKELLYSLVKDQWYKPLKDGKTIKQKTEEGDVEILKAKSDIKEMSVLLNEIIFRNEKFKEAVIREAATGEIKFGKNSTSTANYVLVWSDEKSHLNRLYTIDEYIAHCMSVAKFSISFKTANSSYVTLRIAVD